MSMMYPELARHEFAQRVRDAHDTRRRRLTRATIRRSRHGAVSGAR